MPDDALSKTGRLLVQTGLFRNSVALPLCNLLIMQQITSGCRVFPDEEGTERLNDSLTRRKAKRCRVFPDEEGTESLRLVLGRDHAGHVAEYSPMKRGLK